MLPRKVADPAIALYAFCRLADDAVDLGSNRARCGRTIEGAAGSAPIAASRSNFAADRAFADVVARFSIPRELPEALLEGLAWDAEGRRYETLPDLYAYAARVAGAVGAMMTLVMGQRAPEIVARACDLGVAMQLTNIARDVGEDARAGRLYLPLSMAARRRHRSARRGWPSRPLAARSPRSSSACSMPPTRSMAAPRSGIEQSAARLPARHLCRARALCRDRPRSGAPRARFDFAAGGGFGDPEAGGAGRTLALLQTEWAPASRLATAAQLEETRFLIEAVAAMPLRDRRAAGEGQPRPSRIVWSG